jgi:hypothetical protein
MKNMIPVSVALSDITNTNIPITETLYVAGTSYSLGAQVYKGVFVYESAVAGNTGNDPEQTAGGVNINTDWLAAGFTPIAIPKWLVVGMINKMRMFDGYTSTYSSKTGSIDFTVRKEFVGDVYLIGVQASVVKAQVLSSAGAVLWDSGNINLFAGLDLIDDYYDFFFSQPPEPRNALLIPLGVVTNATDKVRILLTGSGEVRLGKFCAGTTRWVGGVQWGYSDSTLDFSKNITDDFGETYLAQGRYVPVITATARAKTIAETDAIISILDSVRAMGCVWDHNEGSESYQSLICYGVMTERTRNLSAKGDYTIKFKVTGLV